MELTRKQKKILRENLEWYGNVATLENFKKRIKKYKENDVLYLKKLAEENIKLFEPLVNWLEPNMKKRTLYVSEER